MDCIFCKIIKGDIPSYTIYEDDIVKCFLDINPKSNGHTLIIPKKHYVTLEDIDEKTLSHIHNVSKYLYKLINAKLKPDGIVVLQNNGLPQEVKHYHLHLIPQYSNDIPESVETIYNILK